MGKNNEHLKLFIKQPNSIGIDAIGFGLGDKINLVQNQQVFNAVFSIEENEFNGVVNLQLKIKDIQP